MRYFSMESRPFPQRAKREVKLSQGKNLPEAGTGAWNPGSLALLTMGPQIRNLQNRKTINACHFGPRVGVPCTCRGSKPCSHRSTFLVSVSKETLDDVSRSKE